MNLVKGSCTLLALLLLLPVAGCWDREEIEDVGIVLGIGFDKQDNNAAEEMDDKSGKQGNHPSFSMVHQFAIPKQFAAKDAGMSEKDYSNFISEGAPVFENVRNLSTRAERPPNYEHLRIIVISEAVASNIDLNNIINFLLRNTETRRSIRVVIADGKARDVFEKRGLIKNPSLQIMDLMNNYRKTLIMPPEFKLGDMSEKLTGKTSFIVPRVDASGKEAKMAGAAVIKGKSATMIGWLGEDEVMGLNLLKGERKSTGIITGFDPDSGKMIVYEIRSLKSKITPQLTKGKFSFAVEINTEGKLREDWVDPGNAFESEFIKRAEQAIEASIKKAAEKTLAKTLKELRVDVIGFGKKFSIEYPKIWKKLKDDWDDQVRGMQVEVKVNVQIQEFGSKGTKS